MVECAADEVLECIQIPRGIAGGWSKAESTQPGEGLLRLLAMRAQLFRLVARVEHVTTDRTRNRITIGVHLQKVLALGVLRKVVSPKNVAQIGGLVLGVKMHP